MHDGKQAMTGHGKALARLQAAFRARLAQGDNERGVALLSAMIFMIIMAGLSVVIVSTVLGQIVPSNLAQKGTRTIYAAQAGLQTSLGLLRSAAGNPVNNHGQQQTFGDPTKLPCALPGSPLTGNVDGGTNGVTYKVTIAYFAQDPTAKTSFWRADAANQISCTSVHTGTQPRFALLESTGHAPMYVGAADTSTGDRKLSAIYQFMVSNTNIPGGRIYDYNNAYCLHADTKTAGSVIVFKPKASCTDDSSELWIYDTDYAIKLASSTVAGSTELCITGPNNPGEATQDATLQKCTAANGSSGWNQLWSWTGDYTWQGEKRPIADGPSNAWLSGSYGASNSRLQVRLGGASDKFAPSTSVGAGAASYATHQLVNYLDFGRCADVTGEQIGSLFMISYPCKQDPSGIAGMPNLKWNHKWYYTEPTVTVLDPTGSTSLPQELYVFDNTGAKKCLQTPSGTVVYPKFEVCSGDAAQKWVRINNTGTYLTSYWVKDNIGRCLSIDTNPDPNARFNGYSKIIVAACDGSLAQKWNAPPAATESDVSGYREVSG